MRAKLLVIAVLLAAIANAGVLAAAERPVSALIPTGVSYYLEVDLDGVLGKTQATAPVREALGGLQSLEILRELFLQEPELRRGFEEVTGIAFGLSEALGRRVGCAVWLPDLEVMLPEALGSGGSAPADPAAMLPRILVVADVKDATKLEQTARHILERTEATSEPGSVRGAAGSLLIEGQALLAWGEDWMALSFPAELASEAAARAGGGPARASLASDAAYQRATAVLPNDVLVTQYVSPTTIKQLVSATNLLSPSAQFALSEEGIAIGWGVRVEEKQGRQTVTVYETTDLGMVGQLVDPIGVLVATGIVQARSSAKKAVCLSNVKNLALGAMMYERDYGRLPDADHWVAELEEYLNNESVLKCPGDTSEARCSYAMNRALSGKPLSEIEDPSRTVLFYEAPVPGDTPSGTPGAVAAEPRHNGGNNYAYADGHAQWRPESGGGM